MPYLSIYSNKYKKFIQGKVASRFGSSRLPRLRSLCRLESVDLRRIIIGHQRPSYYHGRRIAALQVPNTDPDRMRDVRSACEQLTMFVTHPSKCGCERVLIHSQKAAKPCSGNGSGTLLAQTSADQYLKRAEDFYPRSNVCRIDTTDF